MNVLPDCSIPSLVFLTLLVLLTVSQFPDILEYIESSETDMPDKKGYLVLAWIKKDSKGVVVYGSSIWHGVSERNIYKDISPEAWLSKQDFLMSRVYTIQGGNDKPVDSFMNVFGISRPTGPSEVETIARKKIVDEWNEINTVRV